MKRSLRRRVPVIRQMTPIECGAASLAMVLGYYGRPTTVSEARNRLGVGRDGVTAQAISQAARAYGLRVKAYSATLAEFEHVPLPAIAHWNFNHFVVIERWSPRQIEIVDPEIGRRRLSAAEFDEAFTGVVLTFEPGVHFERRVERGRPAWQRYLASFRNAPGVAGIVSQILLASFALQIFGLAVPLLTKVLVDGVLPTGLDSVMAILGIGIALVVLAQTVNTYLRAALLIYLQARLDTRLMLDFLEHMLSLPFGFIRQRSTGDLLMRLGSNIAIRELLTGQMLSAVLDGTLVLVYLAILLVQAPLFGLIVLALGLVQVALLLSTTGAMRELAQRDLKTQAESQSFLVEALAGIATLKASGAEDRAFDHWTNLFFKQLNVSLRRYHLTAVIDTAIRALQTLAPLLLLWLGATQVLAGSMSLGTMLAVNALAAVFLLPLASLIANGRQLYLVGAHLERLVDVFEAEPEQMPQSDHSPTPPALKGGIELNHVSFRYSPDAPLVLQDISLTIQPGEKVALVGRTGSGKSTLAMLLLGLYIPTDGEIRYDGLPLAGLDYRWLRRQFGVVLQEPFLFSGSVRQNITFNHPTLSLAQAEAAARLAEIHDDVLQMPMQYETLVAEGGGALSSGQRQRLALARALASQPSILLLDEATSHLDTLTEARIDRNLSRVAGTRIVIAHRLSTVYNADQIFVVDGGRIVERGRHSELLALGGLYAELVGSQMAGQAQPEA